MFADSPCRPTIAVRDKANAIGFYRDVLGFKLVDTNQPGATFACGDGTFLEIYPSEFAGSAKNTVAGFEVPDLQEAIRGGGSDPRAPNRHSPACDSPGARWTR